MELTRQYFDQQLGEHLKATEKSLTSYIHGAIDESEERIGARIAASQDELAIMVAKEFERLRVELNLRREVEDLQRQMREVRTELNMA